MKTMLIKLGLLMAATLLFAWSHLYYEKVYKETSDAVIVMQYKVLDKKVWSMEERAKQQALAQDSSYDELQVMQEQKEDADRKQKIGFWLALVFGIVTAGYLVKVLYYLIVVELIRNGEYKTVLGWIKKVLNRPGADK